VGRNPCTTLRGNEPLSAQCLKLHTQNVKVSCRIAIHEPLDENLSNVLVTPLINGSNSKLQHPSEVRCFCCAVRGHF
jgi:hypothetical protein